MLKNKLSSLILSTVCLCTAVAGAEKAKDAKPQEDLSEYLTPGPVKQNCFTHCKVDFNPGKKYITAKREWQGCPTILRSPKKGILYAGWYSGGPGEGLLNYSLMVRSTDGGLTWDKEPLLVIDSLTDQKIQSLDIQYWLDPQGRFWYFWTQRDYNYPMRHPKHLSVWAMICDDPDADTLKWSEPRFVSPGFLRCQPTVLKDGRWILCAYDWVDDYYRYSESFDQGKTWFRRKAGKKYPGFAFDESMVLEQKDGTLRLLARPTKGVGKLIECFSKDGGKTWTDGKLSNIPNPACRFFIKRLKSGKILLINNFEPTDRYDLCVALSEDDGKTWKYKFNIDPRRCTYPDAVEGPDGEIYIIHDYSRGSFKEILLSRLTERDIVSGLVKNSLVIEESFLKHIVNKAPYQVDLTPEERALSDKFRPKRKYAGPQFIAEIDGRNSGSSTKFTDITADEKTMSVKPWKRGPGFDICGSKSLTSKWQTFSFSFVANVPRVVFSLRSQSGRWVDFDDIKAEGTSVYNPSFEEINVDDEANGWRYYSETYFKVGKDDAADGKNYMTCTKKFPTRQSINVTPGQKVTITFKARAGARMRYPASVWHSSGTVKKVK